RDRARGIDPRPLELDVDRISISTEETFDRDIADRDRLHDELRRMAEQVANHLAASGEAARTVTTKVRYPDFTIRTRSTTLAAGVEDAATIAEVPCRLLDRALRDRSGPLRLVGVGVSNIEPFRQLALAEVTRRARPPPERGHRRLHPLHEADAAEPGACAGEHRPAARGARRGGAEARAREPRG